VVSAIAAINSAESSLNQGSATGSIQRVTQAIKQASAKTGVDFSYLLNKATQESNLNPNAKASNSSATGLFQFTSQTWLQTVKSHGGEYGLGNYASHISTDSNGVDHVSDPNWRKAILSLRKDPTVSAEMAGALDKDNMATLQNDVGGKIGPTELYLAHFLGASGAGDFIDTLRSNPKASAASVLPQAAAANPSLFYDKSGAPRSVGSIYKQFAQKFDSTNSPEAGGTMLADASTSIPIPTTVGTPSSATSSFSTAAAANTLAQASSYEPSVITRGVAATNNSLYSAMVIAQMNMHSSGLSGLSGSNDAHKHDSSITDLSAIG
jgi:hypothetical protein